MPLSDDGYPECYMRTYGYGFPWCRGCEHERDCAERRLDLLNDCASDWEAADA